MCCVCSCVCVCGWRFLRFPSVLMSDTCPCAAYVNQLLSETSLWPLYLCKGKVLCLAHAAVRSLDLAYALCCRVGQDRANRHALWRPRAAAIVQWSRQRGQACLVPEDRARRFCFSLLALQCAWRQQGTVWFLPSRHHSPVLSPQLICARRLGSRSLITHINLFFFCPSDASTHLARSPRLNVRGHPIFRVCGSWCRFTDCAYTPESVIDWRLRIGPARGDQLQVTTGRFSSGGTL